MAETRWLVLLCSELSGCRFRALCVWNQRSRIRSSLLLLVGVDEADDLEGGMEGGPEKKGGGGGWGQQRGLGCGSNLHIVSEILT